MLVATEGKVGETYNIGGNNEKKNIDVVNTICDIMDDMLINNCNAKSEKNLKGFSGLITYVQDRPGHDLRYAIDASKIERELGWTPSETFESGIRKTIEWYLSNQVWCDHVQDGSYRGERLGTKI